MYLHIYIKFVSENSDHLIVTVYFNLASTKWILDEYGYALLSSSESSWSSHFLDLMPDNWLIQINRLNNYCGNTLDLIFVNNNCCNIERADLLSIPEDKFHPTLKINLNIEGSKIAPN